MDLIDKENLAGADVAQDAGEVELLLQDRTGSLIERNGKFLRDDAGKGRFSKTGRAAEQDMIHGLTAALGGFDRDRKLVANVGLAGEVGKRGGTQRRFDLAFF